MTREQAGDVVVLMQAATGDNRVSQETLDYFRISLINLDYEEALNAAATGVTLWRRFPSWGEFREFYKAQTRQSQIDEPKPELPSRPPKHPEWVWVWSWCRNLRAPRNLRPFPQQQDFADPDTVISMDEYEQLRQEWETAGSPKAQNPIPLAR